MGSRRNVARIETPLKRILEEDGRRQSWLADKIGATRPQVHGWVHGLHEPSDENKQLIAVALGRHIDEVFPIMVDGSEQAAA